MSLTSRSLRQQPDPRRPAPILSGSGAARNVPWALLLSATLAAATGCGEDSPAPRRDGVPSERAATDRAGTTGGNHSSVLVAAARDAAQRARARFAATGERSALEQARRLLRDAAEQAAPDDACPAWLDLARLEALDAEDAPVALEVLRRALRQPAAAAGADEAPACQREARRMLEVLGGGAPPTGDTGLVQGSGDTSTGRALDQVLPGGVSGDDVAAAADFDAWAEPRVADGAVSALERVSVHGATAVRGREAGVVRVVLHFDRVALFHAGELPADGSLPPRYYLDLRDTRAAPGLAPVMAVGAAGLLRVRTAAHDERTTRVTFDLEPGARRRQFFLGDPYRIVIDVERGPAGHATHAPTGRARPLLVVLDPGHGGDDFGARHEGLREAVLTLDIARRVRVALTRRLPNAQIVMTRDHEHFLSLEERVAFANAAAADVFVSIHLNAADDPVEHGGVATFVLDTNNDRHALRLAARENGTTTGEVSSLQRLLAGLHREDQLASSLTLAALVQRGTLAGGRRFLPHLPDRGVKRAMFYVLVGARMPAILVEASFLTQPEENRALATPRYRTSLAEGIAEGIARYARTGVASEQ